MEKAVNIQISPRWVLWVVCFAMLTSCKLKVFEENNIQAGSDTPANSDTIPVDETPDTTSADLAFKPTSYVFPNITVGTTGSLLALVASNNGNANISSCSSAVLSGSHMSEFILSGETSCNGGVSAGASCAGISIAPKPLTTGSKLATLNLVCGDLSASVTLSYISISAPVSDCPITPLANTYYVSASGNDSNAGTCASPFKTLNRVNTLLHSSNVVDSVLFHRSETFAGSFSFQKSGTSTKPIVIGAYGTGSKPLISGFSTVASWGKSGNIYESAAGVSALSKLNIVLVNGVNTGMGRMPKAGYWTIASSTTTSITDSQLTTNWNGGEVVARTSRWHLDRAKITSVSGNTINFTGGMNYDPEAGWGYFIQNHPSTLTQQNDWYFDPVAQKIKIYSASIPSNVQVPTVDTLVDVASYDYITFDNLAFTGANRYAINLNTGSNIIVQNCDFRDIGDSAVYGYPNSPNIKISNSSVTESNNNGFDLGSSSNATITTSTLYNIGNIAGMGGSGDLSYTCTITHGDNAVVSYNHIQNCGYIGIRWDGNASLIKGNLVDTTNYVKDDGGGIYTYPWQTGPSSSVSYSQRTVTQNTVLNSIGALEGGAPSSNFAEAMGIYNDGTAPNTNYTYNNVANAYFGIFSNAGHDNTIDHNTVYDCQWGLRYNNYENFGIANLTVTNNTLAARTSSQTPAHYSFGSAGILASFSANANVYARPISDTTTIYLDDVGYMTLASWKTYSGEDATSTKSPMAISSTNNIRFEYNETSSNKVVSLGATYKDLRGATYAGTITLAPYSSAVLIK